MKNDVNPKLDGERSARRWILPRRFQSSIAKHMAAIALLMIGFVAGIGVDHAPWTGQSAAGASSSLQDTPAFKTFQEAWDVVHDNYVDPTALDDTKLLYGATSGMVTALNDTGHSTFLTPEETKSFAEQQNSEFVGVGIQIVKSGAKWLILSVFADSPADKAGLKAGDEITAVSGKSVSDFTEADFATALKGEAGTKANITIVRASTGETKTVTMTREQITFKLVTWTMLPGKVAYIQLLQFNEDASLQLKAALDAAKTAGATSIIFDLRDNPGGLGLEATKVASLFLPEGSVVYQEKDKGAAAYPLKTIGNDAFTDQPMVVLINENTASASEILSTALRDNKRATLVGMTTVGTGTGMNAFSLQDGSEIELGVALWLTPNGDSVWHVGVKPDKQVALPAGVFGETPRTVAGFTAAQLAASPDAQLLTAYRLLTSEGR